MLFFKRPGVEEIVHIGKWSILQCHMDDVCSDGWREMIMKTCSIVLTKKILILMPMFLLTGLMQSFLFLVQKYEDQSQLRHRLLHLCRIGDHSGKFNLLTGISVSSGEILGGMVLCLLARRREHKIRQILTLLAFVFSMLVFLAVFLSSKIDKKKVELKLLMFSLDTYYS